MKIYFSCSITGGRNDQPIYAAMVDWMLAQGHTVPTAHLARADILGEEATIDPTTVYERDIAWVDECEMVVAEVSTPSHGAGYEIAYAVENGKKVVCLAREGVKVSKMLTGNPHLNVARYTDAASAIAALKELLAGI